MSIKSSVILLATTAIATALVYTTRLDSQVLAIDGHSNQHASITAHGPFVAVAWGATAADTATDIYVAVSRNGGRTFERPARANDDDSRANLSGEQPPSLSLVARDGLAPTVVVTWTVKAPDGTRLFSARSDDGRSFTRPTTLQDSEAAGNRGWHATATDDNGQVLTLWLDHRETATPAGGGAPAAHAEHQHGANTSPATDGATRAQLSKLFFARADDAGTAQAITGGVCYCCKTALATGDGGAVYAAWRHVYPGNIRDIAFTASRNGGRTFAAPVRVSEDAWELNGCPENGPTLAVDERARVHVAWPTLVPAQSAGSEPSLALFYAHSDDGIRFTPRERIPTVGVPRHVQLAAEPDGTVAMAWDEGEAGARRIAVARGVAGAAGHLTWTRRVVSGDAQAAYPVLASTNDGLVAAWTQGATSATVIRVGQLPD